VLEAQLSEAREVLMLEEESDETAELEGSTNTVS
jgi:hypothetical protein